MSTSVLGMGRTLTEVGGHGKLLCNHQTDGGHSRVAIFIIFSTI